MVHLDDLGVESSGLDRVGEVDLLDEEEIGLVSLVLSSGWAVESSGGGVAEGVSGLHPVVVGHSDHVVFVVIGHSSESGSNFEGFSVDGGSAVIVDGPLWHGLEGVSGFGS